MQHRFATAVDLDRLADWNHQLIEDEHADNAMDEAQLRERMRGWRAVERLRAQVFPPGTRVSLRVLVHNEPALAFWRALGFADHAVTLVAGSTR